MKRLVAALAVLVMVLVACGGSGTEKDAPDKPTVAAVEPVEVRSECDDVGSFVAAVFSIAAQVSETDTSDIRIRWRLMPDGTVRFAIHPNIDDLSSDHYNFYAWNSLDGESGIQKTRFVGASRDQVRSIESPAAPLDQQLCGALDDLEDYVGVSATNGNDTLKSVQSFYEVIFGLTQELHRNSASSMVGAMRIAADEGAYVKSEDEGRFAVSVAANPLDDESDPFSFGSEFVLDASARADELGSALAGIVEALDDKDPITWIIGQSRAEIEKREK